MIRSLYDEFDLDLNEIPTIDILLFHLILGIIIYNLIV